MSEGRSGWVARAWGQIGGDRRELMEEDFAAFGIKKLRNKFNLEIIDFNLKIKNTVNI